MLVKKIPSGVKDYGKYFQGKKPIYWGHNIPNNFPILDKSTT
jgi:hypothetical protein